MSLLFDPILPRRKQTLPAIELELRERLPWLWQPAFKINRCEGYDGESFGARAGFYDDLNVLNVLHEVSHACEMTLLPTHVWRRRVKQTTWGLRIKSFNTVGGERYYEPATLQATERECRVAGIQLHLLEMGGYDTFGFCEDMVIALKYMDDAYFGGDTILNAHEPEKYTAGNKEWVALRRALIEAAYRAFTKEDIQERWSSVMSWLATPVRKSRMALAELEPSLLP
jgi:hypothetical protein